MKIKIKIEETGNMEELSIIDPRNGLGWIVDLMGNNGDLPEYDEDNDWYVMSQDDYDWWHKLTAEYEEADNRYYDLLQECNEDERERLTAEVQDISCDLEDYPGYLNKVLDDFEVVKDSDDNSIRSAAWAYAGAAVQAVRDAARAAAGEAVQASRNFETTSQDALDEYMAWKNTKDK